MAAPSIQHRQGTFNREVPRVLYKRSPELAMGAPPQKMPRLTPSRRPDESSSSNTASLGPTFAPTGLISTSHSDVSSSLPLPPLLSWETFSPLGLGEDLPPPCSAYDVLDSAIRTMSGNGAPQDGPLTHVNTQYGSAATHRASAFAVDDLSAILQGLGGEEQGASGSFSSQPFPDVAPALEVAPLPRLSSHGDSGDSLTLEEIAGCYAPFPSLPAAPGSPAMPPPSDAQVCQPPNTPSVEEQVQELLQQMLSRTSPVQPPCVRSEVHSTTAREGTTPHPAKANRPCSPLEPAMLMEARGAAYTAVRVGMSDCARANAEQFVMSAAAAAHPSALQAAMLQVLSSMRESPRASGASPGRPDLVQPTADAEMRDSRVKKEDPEEAHSAGRRLTPSKDSQNSLDHKRTRTDSERDRRGRIREGLQLLRETIRSERENAAMLREAVTLIKSLRAEVQELKEKVDNRAKSEEIGKGSPNPAASGLIH